MAPDIQLNGRRLLLKPRAHASSARYYVVRFVKDLPVWEVFEGNDLHPAEAPRSGRSLPVLALLPDRFFFFFLPDSAQHQGGARQRLAAARLQMEHMFPASQEGRAGVLAAGGGGCLGYCWHPELARFVQQHKEILGRANAVTTAFFLAWNVADASQVTEWTWNSPDSGTHALVSARGLDYFQGSDHEFQDRLRRHASTANKQWTLSELLSAAPLVGWSRLRLPLPSVNGKGVQAGRLVRLGLILAVLTVLFSLGQGLRLAEQKRQAAFWEQATEDLYGQVLTLPLGPDPYGRLMFRLSQLKTPAMEGLDVVELLGLLSDAAPPGFRLESLSLGPNSGIIRARMDDYDQLETLLKALEQQDRFGFSLDQASSAEREVLVTLRATY